MAFVILGCEESQAVAIEFRKLGHIAFSCDLKPCSGGFPEWHLQMDIFEAIKGGMLVTQSGELVCIDKWDLMICFPTCTYLTVSANKWYKEQPPRKSGTLVGKARQEARQEAIDFAKKLFNCGIKKVAMENPIGVLSTEFRKPNQVIQPWMYGHGETKATCLWLKGLPRLNGFNVVEGREQRLHKLPPTDDRAELRSKTYEGVAKAMAEQWSKYI